MTNIETLVCELNTNLQERYRKFVDSEAFVELSNIFDILIESNKYSRENRCKIVPFPPYHIGAQLIGEDVNEILAKNKFFPKSNFPGLIQNSEEYLDEDGHEVRRFEFEIIDLKNKFYTLFISFKHSHDEYKFIEPPKVILAQ